MDLLFMVRTRGEVNFSNFYIAFYVKALECLVVFYETFKIVKLVY
jgi:hypothetical protein